jgi:enterobactin synthetase component D / holo-[acyl-carrier protein] synthase
LGTPFEKGAGVVNQESLALSRILGPQVAVTQVDIAALDLLAVSPSDLLPEASPKRQREFHAGRSAAANVLMRLGAADTNVTIGPRRTPVWPAGFVGSITHDDDIAIAAATRMVPVVGIGIDIEQVDRFSEHLAERIGAEAEFGLWRERREHPIAHAGIALFSLKESVFKCLHGAVGRYFDFRDVEVYRVDSVLRMRAMGDDGRLAELLPRVRGDVFEVGGRVLSGCILRST